MKSRRSRGFDEGFGSGPLENLARKNIMNNVTAAARQLADFANAEYCRLVAAGDKPGSEVFGFARNQREYRIAIAEADISILAARGLDETTAERKFAATVADIIATMLEESPYAVSGL